MVKGVKLDVFKTNRHNSDPVVTPLGGVCIFATSVQETHTSTEYSSGFSIIIPVGYRAKILPPPGVEKVHMRLCDSMSDLTSCRDREVKVIYKHSVECEVYYDSEHHKLVSKRNKFKKGDLVGILTLEPIIGVSLHVE